MYRGFSGGSVVKNLPANPGDTGDVSSVPGSGRSPGGWSGNSLQYSKNPMDRGAWPGIVHGVPKSLTQLSDWTHTWYTDSILSIIDTHEVEKSGPCSQRHHSLAGAICWWKVVWKSSLMPASSIPMWKTLAATDCSVHGLNSTRSSCGSLIPNARGPQNRSSEGSLLAILYMTKPLPPLGQGLWLWTCKRHVWEPTWLVVWNSSDRYLQEECFLR